MENLEFGGSFLELNTAIAKDVPAKELHAANSITCERGTQ